MRPQHLPPVDELLEYLRERGVEAPPEGPNPHALQGLLALAAHLVDHEKEVSFEGFDWGDPGFVARDTKVSFRFAHATLVDRSRSVLAALLEANRARLGEGILLSLDTRDSGIREYELDHHLYGDVTLFAYPHRPPEPADPRVDAAREAGWAKTLKEHNLLPGRGIVVLDEHQGLFLHHPAGLRVPGVLALLADGQVVLRWNPFAAGAQPEYQYWLSWGKGQAASEWREVLHVRDEEHGG